MKEYEVITWELDDGVGTLTLNRPNKRNALDVTMREEIADVLPRIRRDASVKAVLLTGAGSAFCAGGDLAALGAVRGDLQAARERFRALHTWFPELLNFEKPVIAAVNGAAFGAGFMLALLASPQAASAPSLPVSGSCPTSAHSGCCRASLDCSAPKNSP